MWKSFGLIMYNDNYSKMVFLQKEFLPWSSINATFTTNCKK